MTYVNVSVNPFTFATPASTTYASKDDEIRHLRQQIQQMREANQRMVEGPSDWGTILEVRKATVRLSYGNAICEAPRPTHLPVAPGSAVKINKDKAILAIIDDPVYVGPIHTVVSVIDDKHAEISAGPIGSIAALYPPGNVPKAGDRVQLCGANAIVVRNIGQPKAVVGAGFDTGVTWDDVGGLEDAKAEFIEAIESPTIDAALHERYGQKRVKGLLVAGPPGCGKTLLVKAAASSLARLHGKASTASGYIYVKGPELLNGLVGKSEEQVRGLFVRARAHFAEHGYPAIVCLDEADALLSRRGASAFMGMEKTIVPTFLAEMDGLEESAALVVVLTNRPDQLDPAITREGRLDVKIHVRRPNPKEVEQILAKHLRGKPIDWFESIENAAEMAAAALLGSRHALAMIRTTSGKGDCRFTMGDIVSGAMCAGFVSRAVTHAMRREKAGEKGGLWIADFDDAADDLCAQQKMLDHSHEVAEFVRARGLAEDLRAVERIT
jgi:ATP-dependent 26S proteasome regulatory subunit